MAYTLLRTGAKVLRSVSYMASAGLILYSLPLAAEAAASEIPIQLAQQNQQNQERRIKPSTRNRSVPLSDLVSKDESVILGQRVICFDKSDKPVTCPDRIIIRKE